MSGNEIGVKVGQENMLDLQAVFGRKRDVPIDVALRIDNGSGRGFLISDKIRSVGQTIQIKLLKDNDSPSSHMAGSNARSIESRYLG
jgi:hypothetical protein